MDQLDGESRRGSLKIIGTVAACAAVLVGVFMYLLLGGTTAVSTTPTRPGGDNSPEAARKTLEKETDVTTCRTALTQFNSYNQQATNQHSRGLSKPSQEHLQQRFALDRDPGALREIEGDSYTLLDAHYLDQCFLMRDALRALEGDKRGAALTSLERATNAFAWVVREVRLQDGLFTMLPPQFALRRGWGTAYDRALIFLELLNQMGNDHFCGCLVGWPSSKPNEAPELWACGVLLDNDPKMYLFDPRLGLPLPGPDGQSVATLDQVRKDPALLAQLTVKSENPYDVTAKRAQEVEIYQYCSLSALAPRMRFLEENQLAPSVRVHLAVDDLANEKKLSAAAKLDDKPIPVKVFPGGATLLRQFLPKEEGGADVLVPIALKDIRGFVEDSNPQKPLLTQLTQRNIYELELAPWSYLDKGFRDPNKFPWSIGLGQRVRFLFMDPFVKFTLNPKSARDNMLRGNYKAAIASLSGEIQETTDQLRELHKIKQDPKAMPQIDTWVDQAQKLYAEALRANDPRAREEAQRKIDDLWRSESAGLLVTVLNGRSATVRAWETSYYVALSKHEQAELAQRRQNAQAANGKKDLADKDWDEVLDKWVVEFAGVIRENPNVPEREAVRRLHGEALARLGRNKEAADVLESEVPEPRHPLETVACLYLASRLRNK
jgi:hypothetical protein